MLQYAISLQRAACRASLHIKLFVLQFVSLFLSLVQWASTCIVPYCPFSPQNQQNQPSEWAQTMPTSHRVAVWAVSCNGDSKTILQGSKRSRLFSLKEVRVRSKIKHSITHSYAALRVYCWWLYCLKLVSLSLHSCATPLPTSSNCVFGHPCILEDRPSQM